MHKFCDMCDNLLVPVFANEMLAFSCQSCNLIYKAVEEDTLRREKIVETDVMLYATILKKAGQDPATIKARIPCKQKNCKNEIIKQVRIGDDMKLYNICPVCETMWLN